MTLAYSGKSKKRKGILALSAILAILIGTALAFGGRDGNAFAGNGHDGGPPGGDTTQLNISSSECVSGGAYFHFVAPHTANGTGGTLTVEYTLNGTPGSTTAAESHDSSSSNAHWDITLSGSGAFVVTAAYTTGGQTYTKHGSNYASIKCGEHNLTGSITIVKAWDGGDAGTASFTGTKGEFQIVGNGSKVFSELSAKTYTFTETAMEGWDASVECTGGGDTSTSGATATVNLAAGENVTCTFTNTAQAVSATGNITIVKEWTGGTAETATFSGTEPDFTLNGTTTSKAFTGLESGQTYTFTEGALDNWTSSATCTGADAWSGEGTRSVSVTLGEGEDVTCTFTNTFKQPQEITGSIVINKEWVDASGNRVTTGLPTSATFTLTGNTAGALPDVTLNAGNSWSATVSDLAPDHYVVEEQAIDGWHVVHFECTLTSGGQEAPGLAPGADASFNLHAGDIWTCTFVNQQNAAQGPFTVTIGKFISGDHATPDNTNGASFNMTATWTAANLNGGTQASGSFDLGPTGFNTPNAYEAVTAEMDAGYNYAVVENNVPASASACTENTPFYLAGYGVSSTSLVDAAAQTTLSPTANITNGHANMFIAVVNLPCAPVTVTGAITLNKVWVDANGNAVTTNLPASVNFTATGTGVPGSFAITPSNGTWSTTFSDLAAGNFSFTEATVTGWTNMGMVCVDANNQSVTVTDGGFALAEGAHVTCTVTNQVSGSVGTTGSVTVVKQWIGAGGTPIAAPAMTVDFTATGLGTGNNTFTLGTNGVWSRTFSGLTGGQVTIVEAPISGWNLDSFTCMDSSNNGDVPVSEVADGVPGFTLGTVQNVVCTLVNRQVEGIVPTPTATPATPTGTPTTTTPTATPTTPTSTATVSPTASVTETPVTQTVTQPAVIGTPTTGGQAVGGFFAPGAATPAAPSTGSGSSSSRSFLSLFAILGIVTVAGSSAIFAATRKRR